MFFVVCYVERVLCMIVHLHVFLLTTENTTYARNAIPSQRRQNCDLKLPIDPIGDQNDVWQYELFVPPQLLFIPLRAWDHKCPDVTYIYISIALQGIVLHCNLYSTQSTDVLVSLCL